jgi:hypothetical protein
MKIPTSLLPNTPLLHVRERHFEIALPRIYIVRLTLWHNETLKLRDICKTKGRGQDLSLNVEEACLEVG